MRSVLPLFFILVGLGLCGCGGGPNDMPEVALVTGTITLDGEPLPDATVYFHPSLGGKGSEGITDASGKYELTYGNKIKGAKVGMCTVSITTWREATYDEAGENEIESERPELVHPDFNDETGLEAKVEPGENVFDFEVTARS